MLENMSWFGKVRRCLDAISKELWVRLQWMSALVLQLCSSVSIFIFYTHTHKKKKDPLQSFQPVKRSHASHWTNIKESKLQQHVNPKTCLWLFSSDITFKIKLLSGYCDLWDPWKSVYTAFIKWLSNDTCTQTRNDRFLKSGGLH